MPLVAFWLYTIFSSSVTTSCQFATACANAVREAAPWALFIDDGT